MKKHLLALSVCGWALVFISAPAFALESKATGTKQIIKKEVRSEISTLRASSTEARLELQKEMINKAEESRKMFADKRAEAKKEIDAAREDFRSKIEASKTKVQEQIKIKRTELSEKLKVVKDEKKKETALRVGDEFQQINTKVLARFTGILAKEESIIQKISSKADVIEIGGGDSVQIKADLVIATKSIADARAAIVAQTAKVYTISVKTEAGLRNDTDEVRQLMQQDLSVVRNLVKSVHEAVKKAFDSLEKNPNAQKNKIQTATTTASSTNNQ